MNIFKVIGTVEQDTKFNKNKGQMETKRLVPVYHYVLGQEYPQKGYIEIDETSAPPEVGTLHMVKPSSIDINNFSKKPEMPRTFSSSQYQPFDISEAKKVLLNLMQVTFPASKPA